LKLWSPFPIASKSTHQCLHRTRSNRKPIGKKQKAPKLFTDFTKIKGLRHDYDGRFFEVAEENEAFRSYDFENNDEDDDDEVDVKYEDVSEEDDDDDDVCSRCASPNPFASFTSMYHFSSAFSPLPLSSSSPSSSPSFSRSPSPSSYPSPPFSPSRTNDPPSPTSTFSNANFDLLLMAAEKRLASEKPQKIFPLSGARQLMVGEV